MSAIGDIDHHIMELIGFLPDKKKYQLLKMLEDWRQGQNRCDHRQTCLIPVDILSRDRIYKDFICNLSDSGAYIETRACLNNGQPVWLTFSEFDKQKHYKVKGVIIRNDYKGVAVKFDRKINRNKDLYSKKQLDPFIQLVKNT